MGDVRLEAIARGCRVQIIRMLAHAGSGHPGGSLSVRPNLAYRPLGSPDSPKAVVQAAMGALVIATAILFGAGTTSAEQARTCQAIVQLPNTWARSSQHGVVLFHTHDRSASLSVECSVIAKPLNDRDFAAHIGEEEPSEAPPLVKLGSFRGREWIGKDFMQLEWWLTRDRYVVHFVMTGQGQPVSKSLEARVNDLITMLQVREP
ncbi:MAG TPA: hypothetical protein VE932_16670 [Patescibacteria group bacterium]|nr:hypothetical protein [Patescibacteria group bacterium]